MMPIKVLFLMGLGMVGMAQTQSPRKLIASVEGKDLYVAYCASCHGMDGKGKGPVASALKTAVPDLTQVAKRKGGKFDVANLEKFILGEGEMKASHGSADMPVWGPVFRKVEKDQDLGLVRVRAVVEYLKQLQVK
jgi:mono/diheme cytochrome c family protein